MKEFFSSPTFLLSAIGLVAFGVVIALLWRNTVWEARGITPAVDVARLRTRITGLFPKSIVAWCIVAVVIIPVAVGLWGLSGTSGTPSVPGTGSWSPTPSGVWEFTKDYWFWAIIGLALLFFASNALPESWTKGAKGMVITVAVVLVGAMIVHGIWGGGSSSQQVQLSCPPVSDNDVRRCILDKKPTMFTTERLEYSKYLEFCIVKPAGGEYQSKQTGSKTWLIWSTNGPLPIEYKLLEGSCPERF